MTKVNSFFRKKSFHNPEKDKHHLNKTLGAFDLTMLGVGAVVGGGIFILRERLLLLLQDQELLFHLLSQELLAVWQRFVIRNLLLNCQLRVARIHIVTMFLAKELPGYLVGRLFWNMGWRLPRLQVVGHRT